MESGSKGGKLAVKFLKGEEVNWEKDFVEHMMQGIDTFRSFVTGWYDGTLHAIFFAKKPDMDHKQMICSVLAGYVWDKENPFVKKHKTILKTLAQVIAINQG
jgi:hypothetical protein